MRFVNLCQSHCRESIENCELPLNTTPPHPQPTTHSFIHPYIHIHEMPNGFLVVDFVAASTYKRKKEEETDRRTVSGTWYLPMIIPNDHHHTYVIRLHPCIIKCMCMSPYICFHIRELMHGI